MSVEIENEEQQVEQQEEQEDQQEQESGSQGEAEEQPGAQEPEVEEELVITIGDENPAEEDQESAPEWVKNLRKEQRELKKKLREYEEKERAASQQQQQIVVGAKPTLEGCDYDEEKYDAALSAWYDKKRQADEHARKIEEDKKAQQVAWQAKLDSYAKAKSDLKVKDFDDAESHVKELLDQTQQGIILHGADNPALIVYALGKNSAKAKELASIKDPVKFAIEIGKLGKEIVMKPRAKPPAPEKVPSGSGSLSGATDGTLDRLRAEAEKTGDYTKVMQYKKQLREKK